VAFVAVEEELHTQRSRASSSASGKSGSPRSRRRRPTTAIPAHARQVPNSDKKTPRHEP